MRKAADAAHLALLTLTNLGREETIAELHAAAAAGSFPEVARVLGVPETAVAPASAASASAAAEAGPSTMERACGACGAVDPPLRCSACRGARYCSAECQKRDWRAHKAACKQRQREMMSAATPSAAAGQQ